MARINGYQETGNMVFGHILRQADRYFREEERVKSGITSLAKWKKRKNFLLSKLREMIGPFPERTPLNVRITGRVERAGYTIEKIIFESRPCFHVTANLYLPDNIRAPLPAVLFPCGHSINGKAYAPYQKACISLVKQGFVVLTYDPIGQGERLQYFDPKKPAYGFWGTMEHGYEGNQCYLTGTNLAVHMIWDSVRAIDYLVSRPEVDSERIGCAGTSGGGTMTAYLCALEERITAAAPCCYITQRKIYLQTGNPHDAEQNLSGAIRYGLNYDDFLSLFAPKPLLIGACIYDFFPIEGTRIAYQKAKKVYSLYNVAENVSLKETVSGHELNRELREALCNWFNLHLKGRRTRVKESELKIEKEKTLQCTETGQVLGDFRKIETVFSLNREFAAQTAWRPSLFKTKKDIITHRKQTREKLRDIFGFEERRTRPFDPRRVDRKKKREFTFEKWFFYSEEGIIVPLLIMEPEHIRKDSLWLFMGDESKEEIISDKDREIGKLLREGSVVCALDYRGIGETKSRPINSSPYHGAWGTLERICEDCIMLESPLITMQTFDVVQTVSFLREELQPGRIHFYGKGRAALIALFAACFADGIGSLTLENMLVSFRSLVDSRKYRAGTDYIISGVLQKFDVTDVLVSLAPLKVLLRNVRSGSGRKMSSKDVMDAYSAVLKAYGILGKRSNIVVRRQ